MIIVRHGEIFTKSEEVRRRFILRLSQNIRAALPGAKIANRRMRLFVEADDEAAAIARLRKVFGIVSLSRAQVLPWGMPEISGKAVEMSKGRKGSFAVRCQRLSKNFPLTSQQVNGEIGAAVKESTGLRVDLVKPDHVLHIEIFEKHAYLYSNSVEAVGGLPLGTSGYFLAGDDDYSLLAAWLMMRRGAKAIIVGKKGFLSQWDFGAKAIETGENGREKAKAVFFASGDLAARKTGDMPSVYPLAGLGKAKAGLLLGHVKRGEIPPSLAHII